MELAEKSGCQLSCGRSRNAVSPIHCRFRSGTVLYDSRQQGFVNETTTEFGSKSKAIVDELPKAAQSLRNCGKRSESRLHSGKPARFMRDM